MTRGLTKYSPDGTILAMDPRCCKCWGDDNFVGKNFMSWLPGKNAIRVAEQARKKFLDAKIPVIAVRHFWHRSRGIVRNRALIEPIFDTNHDIQHVRVYDECLDNPHCPIKLAPPHFPLILNQTN